jgi:hypothetical protein
MWSTRGTWCNDFGILIRGLLEWYLYIVKANWISARPIPKSKWKNRLQT